nr:MAG TPA: hypothetical protein [Caudoviricetes sp.]DAH98885.1 MAG TPA: hypothetical protein [Caudoviricetes sp.]
MPQAYGLTTTLNHAYILPQKGGERRVKPSNIDHPNISP